MRRCNNCKYTRLRPTDIPCKDCENKSEWTDIDLNKVMDKDKTVNNMIFQLTTILEDLREEIDELKSKTFSINNTTDYIKEEIKELKEGK